MKIFFFKGIAYITMILTFIFCTDHTYNMKNTICNPININYRFDSNEKLRRDISSPCIVLYDSIYYLFASNTNGYFSSNDLCHWKHISANLPSEAMDPTAVEINGELYFTSSFKTQTIFKTDDPQSGEWEVATDSFPYNVAQPMLFYDNNKLFMYAGMGSLGTLTGIEINPQTWSPIGTFIPLISTNKKNGWEIPGDYNDWTSNNTWIEGAWMIKYKNCYYLQYSTPGGYLKSINDGVYISNNPLGPFKLAVHNPISAKPEGFLTGAGNGCIFQDKYGNFWHIGLSTISTKHIFERRLILNPVFFDNENILYAYTGWGDYPMHIPNKKVHSPQEIFTQWMLLSFDKKTEVSSELRYHPACCAVDENIRSCWSAKTNNKGEYLMVDLDRVCEVYAIQINFADHNSSLPNNNLYYQYQIEASNDKLHWEIITDDSHKGQETPHDYIQFSKPIKHRYFKITNINCPHGNFSLSGFRIFGKTDINPPCQTDFYVSSRDTTDRRKVTLKWNRSDNAIGYNIRYGSSPNKLYQNHIIYNDTEICLRNLQADQTYYFSIDSFNEGGITYNEKIIEIK